MLTARLEITASDHHELDQLLAGRADIQITRADAGVGGELVRHTLRPLLVEALTPAASVDPTAQLSGPLVRVHINRPDQHEGAD